VGERCCQVRVHVPGGDDVGAGATVGSSVRTVRRAGHALEGLTEVLDGGRVVDGPFDRGQVVGQRSAELVQPGLDDQAVASIEVVVDRARRDVGRRGDLEHLHGVVAPGFEGGDGFGQDACAGSGSSVGTADGGHRL
jgi:hypothetical protein